MKKTLNDLLNEKKYQKVNVKIGCIDGSSFWYCGKGKLSISLLEIKKAQDLLVKQSRAKLTQLKHRLKKLDQIYDDMLYFNKSKVKNLELYTKQLKARKEHERKLLPKKIESVEYDIATPLLDRPIVEIVCGISSDETPCWIVYIKGNECGSYWTIKEYNRRNHL